jgi:hypothetical protein
MVSISHLRITTVLTKACTVVSVALAGTGSVKDVAVVTVLHATVSLANVAMTQKRTTTATSSKWPLKQSEKLTTNKEVCNMGSLPGASNVVTNPGIIAALAGAVAGFFGFIGALLKLVLVAAALGTGFGAPIVLLAWYLNRNKGGASE